MRKFIQIRGPSGAGKTTAVTQYCEHKGIKEKVFDDGGKERKFCANETTLVVGRMARGKINGLDILSKDKEETIRIVKFAVTLGYDTIIVEGNIYGKSQNLSYSIRRIAEKAGYTYCSIFLYSDLCVLAERVCQRNENYNINVEYIYTGIKETYRTHNRLMKMTGGIAVDTNDVEKDRMWEIIGGITDGDV